AACRVNPSLVRAAQLDLERRAREPELLADLVFEVPRIREVHRRWPIHEEHERRSRTLRLGYVVEANLLAVPVGRRGMGRDGFHEHAMQVRCRDALLALVHDRERCREGLLDTTAGLGGCEA